MTESMLKTEELKLPTEGLTDAKTIATYLKISPSMLTKLRKAGVIKEPIRFGASARWDVGYIRELAVTGVSMPKQSEAA